MIIFFKITSILFYIIGISIGIDTNFKIHLSEQKLFARLSNAIDLHLIHHGNVDGNDNETVCILQQRGIDLQTQEIQIINPNTFIDLDFNPDTPINIRQFIGMAHIKDGIIALSSDNFIFMLKFKYERIHSQQQDFLYSIEEDDSPDFASLIWKADLKSSGSITNEALIQIPQLVYSFENNIIMLVYTDSVIAMNVSEMETQSQTAQVYSINGILGRKERGWTKCIGSLMISAVGSQGMDFYYMKDYQFTLITTLKSNLLWKENQSLRITDFSILKCPSNDNFECYHLYLMDDVRGILVIEVILNINQQIQFKLLLDRVGRTYANGQILDTYDGKTIFAAYDYHTKWIIEEISIDTNSFSWFTVSTYQQRTRVLDIQINEDFAIIQGINHQQFYFYGQNEAYKYYSNYQPILVNFGNVRDIAFFKQTHMEDPKIQESLQKGLIAGRYFDDFFFGVGKYKMFVTRYMQSKPGVLCFTENTNTVGKKYIYTLSYNTTACPYELDSTISCHESIDFSVEVVKTLLFNDKIQIVMIVLVLVGVVFLLSFVILCVLYRKFIINSRNLQQQISTCKNLTTTISKIEMVDVTNQQELTKQVQQWK